MRPLSNIASLRRSGGRGWAGATLIYAWWGLIARRSKRATAARAALLFAAELAPRQRSWP